MVVPTIYGTHDLSNGFRMRGDPTNQAPETLKVTVTVPVVPPVVLTPEGMYLMALDDEDKLKEMLASPAEDRHVRS